MPSSPGVLRRNQRSRDDGGSGRPCVAFGADRRGVDRRPDATPVGDRSHDLLGARRRAGPKRHLTTPRVDAELERHALVGRWRKPRIATRVLVGCRLHAEYGSQRCRERSGRPLQVVENRVRDRHGQLEDRIRPVGRSVLHEATQRGGPDRRARFPVLPVDGLPADEPRAVHQAADSVLLLSRGVRSESLTDTGRLWAMRFPSAGAQRGDVGTTKRAGDA